MNRILFAITQSSDRTLENGIQDKYKKKFNKNFTYDSEYYCEGIKKVLEEKDYDILILKEDLERMNPVTIEFMDEVTDKHNNLKIIFIIDDEHEKDEYVRKLFSLGVYNIIFKEDLTLDSVAELIETSRSKKDAKIYLGIDEVDPTTDSQKLQDIPDEQLKIIFKNMKSATVEQVDEIFLEIHKSYNEQQILFLISLLPEEILNKFQSTNNPLFSKYLDKWQGIENGCTSSDNNKEKKESKKKPVINIPIPSINFIRNKSDNKPEVKSETSDDNKEKENVIIKTVVEQKVITKKEIQKIYETPKDYKKKVGFVGCSQSGVTTLINLVSQKLADSKVKVAILDMTQNRDMYEIYPFNDEDNANGEGLVELVKGSIKPYKINKYIDLYTASFSNPIEVEYPSLLIESLEQDYDVVIIDMDYETPINICQTLNSIYLVQTLDVLKLKYNTAYQLYLKEKVNIKKIRYVINQVISCDIKPSDIIKALKTHTDIRTLEQNVITDERLQSFVIPFDIEVKKMSHNCIFNVRKLEEKIEGAITEISRDIYPISSTSSKEKPTNMLSKFFNRNKTKDIVSQQIEDDLEDDLIQEE